MLTNPVVLNNGSANVNYDFGGAQVGSSVYRNTSAAMDQPMQFNVKHQTTNAGKVTQSRRSVYQITRVCENDEGEQGTMLVQLQVTVPEKVATAAQLTEELNKMISFLDTQSTTTVPFSKIIGSEI